jgi:hypothetical protein
LSAPLEQYSERLAARRATLDRSLAALARSWTFLILSAAALILCVWLTFFAHRLPRETLAAPLVVSVLLAHRIHRTNQQVALSRRRVLFYETGMARLSGNWQGSGNPGRRFETPGHLYARDLDVFGSGCLFELLCIARTHLGQTMLAHWLSEPAPLPVVLERQQAVAELRPLLDLREHWAIAGKETGSDSASDGLFSWLNAPPIHFPILMRILAPLLAIAFAALLASSIAGLVPTPQLYRPAIFIFVSEAILFSTIRRRVLTSQRAFTLPQFELATFLPLLRLMEAQTFQSALLQELYTQVKPDGVPVSRHGFRLSILGRIPPYLRQEYLALFCAAFLAGTHLAFLTEHWRRKHAASTLRALAALAEFEALLCLATYAAEHPADPFPHLHSGGAFFHAEQLGHPLLPEPTSVRNSVRLGGEAPRLFIVSGSNMSGKSTLLRSIGLNSVLAWAGAPVRAQTLTLSELAVSASIGVSDTLLDGKSRFYAEVERLRAILTLAEARPTLFLLDEILSGTNSQDRHAGAQAILNELLRTEAIGLVTTHDLSLTTIASAHAVNVHFQEQFLDGTMTFDYRMKPGILDRTNGLAIIRMLGIPVPPGTS